MFKRDNECTVLLSVSSCFYNRLPLSSVIWPTITQIYYYIVLEVRSPVRISLDQNQGIVWAMFLGKVQN